MNEIASGPVSAIPLKSTHVNTETSIETVQAPVKRVREEVTVIDTYDWRGVKSSVSREYIVDRFV